MKYKKILIIRFSAIGDIVLTTPVIRSIKQQLPGTAIHYLTKASNHRLLEFNPYLDKIHLYDEDLEATIRELKREKFARIIDLHHNQRTLWVKLRLGVAHVSFPKENLRKYSMVRFKKRIPPLDHIVQRYGATLATIGLSLDTRGLDFFLPEGAELQARSTLAKAGIPAGKCLGVVLGAQHLTKRWIPDYFIQTLNTYNHPVVLIGGPDAVEEAGHIAAGLAIPFLNTVGQHGILESAAIMKQCQAVLTHDTGFMHIAAAFGMKIFSLWGNTVPEFGMTPYRTPHVILENNDLSCRPCSKIGFDICPRSHFKCMREITPEAVVEALVRGV